MLLDQVGHIEQDDGWGSNSSSDCGVQTLSEPWIAGHGVRKGVFGSVFRTREVFLELPRRVSKECISKCFEQFGVRECLVEANVDRV
jgi:hypothetical protein